MSQASQEAIETAINSIRFLSIDAVNKANSGHPGLPMGAAPMSYLLWNEFMTHNPKNPFWFNRDRFVLSAGHGSMLLYSLLHLSGYASVSVSFCFFYGICTVNRTNATHLHTTCALAACRSSLLFHAK